MPTSLTYIVPSLEALHLGDLLRIWVRPGVKITLSHQDFQGPTGARRTAREARCFTGTTSLSPAEPIPGSPSLTKKRELFPGLPPTSPGAFASPHRTPAPKGDGQSPRPGSGILTRLPFATPGRSTRTHTHTPFRTDFSIRSGPTDPCSTAVHMEPFSTSVFKVLV